MKKRDIIYLLVILLLINVLVGMLLRPGNGGYQPSGDAIYLPSDETPSAALNTEGTANLSENAVPEDISGSEGLGETEKTALNEAGSETVPNTPDSGLVYPEGNQGVSGVAPVSVPGDEPGINARSAVVLDYETGTVLFEKNAYIKRPMASTTKIMTAILALENSSLDEIVHISGKAARMDGSVMGIKTDSDVSMKDLLYGMLLCSGNDAAVAIAEHIGGSVEGFAELMNQKALELGAYSTSFSNPHGLDAENHYTTAYDLAKIARYALNIPMFNEVVRTKEYYYQGRQLRNTNEMLAGYDGADGIKTGYTGLAGRCLVSSATKDGRRFISVVLFCDSKNLRTESSRKILDYTFEHYSYVQLLEKGKTFGTIPVERSRTLQEVQVAAADDIKAIMKQENKDALYTRVSLPEMLPAPVLRGTIVGTVSIFNGDTIVAETSLITLEGAEKMRFSDYLGKVLHSWTVMMGTGSTGKTGS